MYTFVHNVKLFLGYHTEKDFGWVKKRERDKIMEIAYIKPLVSAIKCMKNALFNPFNLKKWFVIGFTAFLAHMLDGPYTQGKSDFGNEGSKFWEDPDFRFEEILNFPQTALEWLMENPGWLIFFSIVAVIIITIIIVLLWLSSRGKFMFLNNVVYNRAEVVKPWHQFARQGNSLFLWRLAVSLIGFAVFLSFFIISIGFILKNYHGFMLEEIPIPPIVGIVFIFLFLLLLSIFIGMLVDHFIVPIMHKFDLTILQAWARFLPLLGRYFLQFVFYSILIFVLTILVIIAVVLIGIFTCCIGCLLLIIPYISAVFTLPISYSFRAYSLEFLAQFGEEYNLFPAEESEAPVEV
jgi:hypothetical protein